MIIFIDLVLIRYEKKLYFFKNIFFIKKYFLSFYLINKEDYLLMVFIEL